MGAHGMASWFMAVDDPEPPSGPSAQSYEFDVVIHQVRHPLRVIASVAQFILRDGRRAPGFIERNLPELNLSKTEEAGLDHRQQLILKAARYWYHWNRIAERKADVTVRLEDLEKELPALCALVGVDHISDVFDHVPQNINARCFHIHDKPWTIDWAEMRTLDSRLNEKIRDLAESYGYKA
jgi:hypothetical protein